MVKCSLPGRINGAVVIVTGASSGIGLETTAELARRGATVIMAAPSSELLEKACLDILARYSADVGEKAIYSQLASPGMATYMSYVTREQLIPELLDLASFDSIKKFVSRIQIQFRLVHLLINNAAVITETYEITQEGFEMQMGVNYIGHVLLTRLLLPQIRLASSKGPLSWDIGGLTGKWETGRIIILTSKHHQNGHLPKNVCLPEENYCPFQAYQSSNMANVLFAIKLAKLEQDTCISVTSVHPGMVKTQLYKMLKKVHQTNNMFPKSVWQGVQTVIHCALMPKFNTGIFYANCEPAISNAASLNESVINAFYTATERLIAWAEKKQISPTDGAICKCSSSNNQEKEDKNEISNYLKLIEKEKVTELSKDLTMCKTSASLMPKARHDSFDSECKL